MHFFLLRKSSIIQAEGDRIAHGSNKGSYGVKQCNFFQNGSAGKIPMMTHMLQAGGFSYWRTVLQVFSGGIELVPVIMEKNRTVGKH